MSTYKLLFGRFRRSGGDVHEAGEEIELTDAEYDRWSGRFEEVEEVEDTGEDATEGDVGSDDEDAFPADEVVQGSAYDLIEDVESGVYDEFLDELQEAESNSRERVTVIESINDRRADMVDG